jgi:hypothetical protein
MQRVYVSRCYIKIYVCIVLVLQKSHNFTKYIILLRMKCCMNARCGGGTCAYPGNETLKTKI